MSRSDSHSNRGLGDSAPRAVRGGAVMLSSGDLVDHYSVIRSVARGGMGEVYLARDTQLGRRVALKVMGPEHLKSETAIASFLDEARTTARFSHPNIVTIYAVGRAGAGRLPIGTPYLALEYLEGENLDQRMQARQPSLQETLRIGVAIAHALQEAHKNEVLHLDLKPANVIIPPDGRLRVLDFGLATVAGRRDPTMDDLPSEEPSTPEGTLVRTTVVRAADGLEPASTESADAKRVARRPVWGTPSYMAPEQWKGKELSAAADVWALGVMLFEMATDGLPFTAAKVSALRRLVTADEPAPRAETRVELPAELCDLLARCLDKTPARRPSAGEVVDALEELLFSGRPRDAGEASPFRGLLPFTHRHADMFFGREEEIASFVERVRAHPILPVVGPSGAGKSSFVHAGVVPRLREQHAWLVLRMRPGTRPFHTLAARLVRSDNLTVPLAGPDEQRAEAGWSLHPFSPPSTAPSSGDVPGRALRGVAGGSAPPPARDLDDTNTLADKLREAPLQLSLELRALSEDHGVDVLLVVDQLEELFTMVDDHETRCRFMQALCTAADDPDDPIRVVFTVRDDFLGRLATGPEVRAALAHVTVIQSLGREQLEEILERPVDKLGYRFEAGLVREMTETVSGEPGGLPLLQFAAQQLWEQRDTKRRLLLFAEYQRMGGVEGALARHADGVVEGLSPAELRSCRELLLRMVTPERTRRIVPRSEALAGLERGGDDAAEQVLARLTSARLVQARRMRTQDDHAAPSEIGLELVHESLIKNWRTLARWLDENHEGLSFLAEAGQAAELWHKRGRVREELWRGAALEEALRKLALCSTAAPPRVTEFFEAGRAYALRAKRRRRAVVAAALSVSLTVAVVAVLVALLVADKEREARTQRNDALAQRAEALREGARAAVSQGNVLEGRAKLRVALTLQDSPSARALWWQLSAEPLVWRKQLGALVYDVAFSPDGKRVGVASHDKAIYEYDVVTGDERILRGHRDQVYAVAYSKDGRHLASASWNGDVVLWDAVSGEQRALLEGHRQAVVRLAFSPDDKSLASASSDATAAVWDVESRRRTRLLSGHGGAVSSVSFSPDGLVLATASADGAVRLWKLSAPEHEPARALRAGDGGVIAVAFDRDGGRLVAGGQDGAVRVWDVARAEVVATLAGHSDAVHGVAFVGSDVVVSGSYDKTVRLWDVGAGKLVRVLRGHTAAVRSIAVSPDGKRIASAARDRSVRLWDVQTSASWPLDSGHTAGVYGVAFSPDGERIATCSIDQTVRLWETATGDELGVLEGHTAGVWDVRFSHSGAWLASSGMDDVARLWDAHSGASLKVLAGHGARVASVAFSPDDALLATAGDDATVRLWALPEGREQAVLHDTSRWLRWVAFSPDGATLATCGSDATIGLWDVASRAKRMALEGHTQPVYSASFSPDGQRLASGSLDGTVRLFDLTTGKGAVIGKHQGRVYEGEFHPDGRRVGEPSSDGVAIIWALDGRPLVTLTGHSNEVNDMCFSRDGRLAATASDDGTVRLWDADDGRPVWRAPMLTSDDEDPLLYTHLGWRALRPDGQAVEMSPPPAAWRKEVERWARLVSASGDSLCILGDDKVELWSRTADRRLAELARVAARDTVATAGACAVLASSGAVLVDAAGSRELAKDATAIAADGDELVVAAGSELLSYAPGSREPRARRAASVGATALARVGAQLVVGYQDGNIEVLRDTADGTPRVTFEQVPASAVVRILEGPEDTLIVGYADGVLGMWSRRDGKRLAQSRLHGRVSHLLLRQHRVYAATDLGRHLVWDLEAFAMPYCDLLRQVWRAVPVEWEHGRPVSRPPPVGHPCAAGASE